MLNLTLLTAAFSFGATESGSDLGGTLLGVAALVTAVGAIFLGVRNQRRSTSDDSDLESARQATFVLASQIADLNARLEVAESELAECQAKVLLSTMHIGMLEGMLADLRKDAG